VNFPNPAIFKLHGVNSSSTCLAAERTLYRVIQDDNGVLVLISNLSNTISGCGAVKSANKYGIFQIRTYVGNAAEIVWGIGDISNFT
jgi:hypothetical protein